jgi:hypothetical protein
LLDRVAADHADEIAVFDISLESNRNDVERLLASGASLRYFDHHFAGDPIDNPRFLASIDTAPDQCTSLLVDFTLNGRFRPWAIVAAFGDNLHHVARTHSEKLGLNNEVIESLAELGELLNYNAYGDSVADLHFPPDALYRLLAPFSNPLEFIKESPAFAALQSGFRQDFADAERGMGVAGCALGAARGRCALESTCRVEPRPCPCSVGTQRIGRPHGECSRAQGPAYRCRRTLPTLRDRWWAQSGGRHK